MQPVATLKGHAKWVTGCVWHRHAENTLASMGTDCTVRIWDVESQKASIVIEKSSDVGCAMRWSPDGSMIANMCKNKELFIFDPRNTDICLKAKVHMGPKMCKMCWIDNNTILTSGSDQQAGREYFVWDARKMDQKVTGGQFPAGVGVTHLYMDHEHRLVYAAHRGEMNIGIY